MAFGISEAVANYLLQLGWQMCRSRSPRHSGPGSPKGEPGVMLAFSAKAGHNNEPHNHNDLGHFILHGGGENLLCDLGAGLYTKAYFSPGRESIINISSSGHSVPVINGTMQQSGAKAKAVVLDIAMDEQEEVQTGTRFKLQQAITAGEHGLAGAFRRAADLCWQAISRWQTDDGKLHIVRNHYSSEARHGFEVYSNHTCYSLWTAAVLAHNLLNGEEMDRISPTFIPAEIGSRVLATDGWFQTVIAAVEGQQMLVQTSVNDPYNVPGIVRIQQSALSSLIGPSSAGHADRGFTGFAEGDIFPLSYTPAWQTEDGKWHSLSEGIPGTLEFDRDGGIDPQDGGGTVQLEQGSASDGATDFALLWKGPGVREIRTHYRQVPGKIEVAYELQGNIQKLGALIPLMAYDGRERSVIHHVMSAGRETESIRVEYAGASLD